MPSWSDVFRQIQTQIQEGTAQAQFAVDIIRRKYLRDLENHTQRNLIAYYSGFLSKGVPDSDINDEDMNGFMMAIHGLDRSKGLDLLLHTPGGSISATESIVTYLHKMFGRDIRAIIPQIAMSAGTMIACSCSSILMSCKHASLGPTDPHLGGMPAKGVIEEFRRACREIKKDPSRIPIWQVIIGQYNPTFLSQCENAIKWANQFVEDQLVENMFDGEKDARKKARKVVGHLTDYRGNKNHDRHIGYDECKKIGLTKVASLEDDGVLQDLVLTVHHCYMHALMNTPSFKIIENHEGAAFVKQQGPMPESAPTAPSPPSPIP